MGVVWGVGVGGRRGGVGVWRGIGASMCGMRPGVCIGLGCIERW